MYKRIALLLAVSCLSAFAADTVPSEDSIKQLLIATQAPKMIEGILPQMDAMMQSAFQQAFQGREISADAQKAIEKSRTDALAAMKEEMSWSKLEPVCVRIYQKSLTQDEVDGMLAFYHTPAGQAMVAKMPGILQNTMAEVQTLMGPTMQRLHQSQQELVTKLHAESKPKK